MRCVRCAQRSAASALWAGVKKVWVRFSLPYRVAFGEVIKVSGSARDGSLASVLPQPALRSVSHQRDAAAHAERASG